MIPISLQASRFVQSDKIANVYTHGERLADLLKEVIGASLKGFEPEHEALTSRVQKQIDDNSKRCELAESTIKELEAVCVAESKALDHVEACQQAVTNAPADKKAILASRDDLYVAQHLYTLKTRERADVAARVPTLWSPNVSSIPEVVLSAVQAIATQVSRKRYGQAYEGEGAIDPKAWARYLAMTTEDLAWIPLAAKQQIIRSKEYSQHWEGSSLLQHYGLPKDEFLAAIVDFKKERAASIQAKVRAAEAALVSAKETAASLAVAS